MQKNQKQTAPNEQELCENIELRDIGLTELIKQYGIFFDVENPDDEVK